jgi:hypothetical protein
MKQSIRIGDNCTGVANRKQSMREQGRERRLFFRQSGSHGVCQYLLGMLAKVLVDLFIGTMTKKLKATLG